MLELKAPVSCEVCLCCQDACMQPEQAQKLIEKIGAEANELKLVNLEDWFVRLGSEALNSLLKALEDTKKCFHVYFNASGSADTEAYRALLSALKQNSRLGTVVFSFEDTEALSEAAGWGAFCLASDSGFDVCASVVLGNAACGSIDSLIEEALDAGASFVLFERQSPFESTVPSETLKEAARLIRESRDLGNNVSFSLCFPNCISEAGTSGCFAGTVSCFIDSCGRMSPCRYSKLKTDNSAFDSEIGNLWKDSVFNRCREIENACEGCIHAGMCPNGCLIYPCELKAEDPLSCVCGGDDERILQEVVLEDELCPVPRYNVRREDFGWILMRGSVIIPVTSKAGPILSSFTGDVSLGEIEEKFGQGALSFIYSLYVRGFIEFKENKICSK